MLKRLFLRRQKVYITENALNSVGLAGMGAGCHILISISRGCIEYDSHVNIHSREFGVLLCVFFGAFFQSSAVKLRESPHLPPAKVRPKTSRCAMEEADEIVGAVTSIFDVVTREFTAAAAGMEPGRWIGLDADGRARLALESHSQVDKLTAVFDRVQCAIDAVPHGERTAAELAAAEAAVRADVAARRATNDALAALVEDAARLALVSEAVNSGSLTESSGAANTATARSTDAAAGR